MTHARNWILQWLGRMPLAGASDLGAIGTFTVSQINRALNAQHREGLVTYVTVGQTRRVTRRWFLTARGVAAVFATDHRHPTPEDRKRYGLSIFEDYTHDTVRSSFELWHQHGLDEDESDHHHVPWWVTPDGLQRLLRRLPVLEQIYARAPGLLRAGQREIEVPFYLAGADIQIIGFSWVRHDPVIEAVAIYSHDFWVPFTWAGIQGTATGFERKWTRMFGRLDQYLEPRIGSGYEFMNDDRPSYIPEPSGIAIAGADWWGRFQLGKLAAGLGGPLFSWSPDGQEHASGVFRESRDMIADPFRQHQPGTPESILAWVREDPGLQALNGVLPTRLFMLIEQRPAMRLRDLARECHGASAAKIRAALQGLLDADLICDIDGYYYLADPGMVWTSRRDRWSVQAVRGRFRRFLGDSRWWHNRERLHNIGINEIGARSNAAGLPFATGWRFVVNVPGVTQLAPDGVILVSTGPFGPGPYLMEFERSAVEPQSALKKCLPHRKAQEKGVGMPVIFVVENAEVEALYQQIGADLRLLTTTLADVRKGPVVGRETCWRYQGKPVEIR